MVNNKNTRCGTKWLNRLNTGPSETKSFIDKEHIKYPYLLIKYPFIHHKHTKIANTTLPFKNRHRSFFVRMKLNTAAISRAP